MASPAKPDTASAATPATATATATTATATNNNSSNNRTNNNGGAPVDSSGASESSLLFENFLKKIGCKDFDTIRNASSEDLTEAMNQAQLTGMERMMVRTEFHKMQEFARNHAELMTVKFVNKDDGTAQEQTEDKYVLCSQRHKIILERKVDAVTVVEYSTVKDCDGATVIEGFPSEGLTGTIVGKYLAKQLKLPLVGEIQAAEFPELGVISNYQPTTGARIYGDKRLVVFVSEFKLSGNASQVTRSLVNAIYDFAERHRAKMIITSEGVPKQLKVGPGQSQQEIMMSLMDQYGGDTQAPESGKKDKKKKGESKSANDDDELEYGEVYFATNDHDLANKMKTLEKQPLKDALVGGITGGIMSVAPIKSIPVINLFSPFKTMLPDTTAAIPIIGVISKLLGGDFEIDTKDLVEDTKKMEKEIKSALQGMLQGPRPQMMYT